MVCIPLERGSNILIGGSVSNENAGFGASPVPLKKSCEMAAGHFLERFGQLQIYQQFIMRKVFSSVPVLLSHSVKISLFHTLAD